MRLLEFHGIAGEESQTFCCNSRKTRRFYTQSEMRPFSVVASREKSHLHSCALKGSLIPLMQLKKFPDIPFFTREEHRGSAITQKSPVFPSSSRDEGLFSCFVGTGIPSVPLHLKRRCSQLESREELQGWCHHSKDPDVPVHSRYT